MYSWGQYTTLCVGFLAKLRVTFLFNLCWLTIEWSVDKSKSNSTWKLSVMLGGGDQSLRLSDTVSEVFLSWMIHFRNEINLNSFIVEFKLVLLYLFEVTNVSCTVYIDKTTHLPHYVSFAMLDIPSSYPIPDTRVLKLLQWERKALCKDHGLLLV